MKNVVRLILALSIAAGIAIPVFGGDDSGNQEAFQLFPVGKPWTGVRVPKYNEKDELVSLMDSRLLTRENEELLKLDDLTVVMFKKDGSVNMRLKTMQGIFNVKTGKLRSRSPANIEHAKFNMRGDRMEFDTETQVGKLNGNVVMEIFDTGSQGSLPLPQTMTSSAANLDTDSQPELESSSKPSVKQSS